MRANEFIEKFGIEHAKYLLEDITLEYFAIWSQCAGKSFQDTVCVKDLKRYVDAYGLVEIHGFEKSKEIVVNAPSDDHFYSWNLGGSGIKDKTVHIGTLRKAITLVEECQ